MPEEPEAKPSSEAREAGPAKAPPGAREDFRYVVRFANTDLDGARPVVHALRQVKGVGPRVASAVANLAQVPREELIGNLSEEKTAEIEGILSSLHERAPGWLLNRPRDPETGRDVHVVGAEIDLQRRDDINRMKMIRSYKGVRHGQGAKGVRGQRTRGNFRTGLSVGVTKKAAVLAAKAAKAKAAEEKGKKA